MSGSEVVPREGHPALRALAAGRVGRYRIDRRIGSGGMSHTYRCALDGVGGFRKLVVVKVLHPDHLTDDAFVQMFLDEARLSARLSHPHISQVFEVGVEEGMPFLVMEYVAGPDLAQLARKLRTGGVRHFGHIARLFAGVARGLAHAHALTDEDGQPLRIVHRDVSLGNIVLSPDGIPKLIDFGIAHWAQRGAQTEVGLLKGKLHYMAPEQLKGEIDHRVDIYQLGVCLYWLSTGRPPYHSEDPMQIWRDRLAGNALRPSSFIPEYPAALEAIVMKAIARDPDARYASADQLADDLLAFCASNAWFHSSDAAVAAWGRGLFSHEELEVFRTHRYEIEQTDPVARMPSVDRLTESGSARSISMGIDAGAGTAAPPLPAAGAFRPWMALVAGALLTFLLVGAVSVGLRWGGDPAAADRAARIYLEEAARLAGEGDAAGARAMAEKARAAGSADPALDVALTRLEKQLGGPSSP